jgi:hypothetical protein
MKDSNWEKLSTVAASPNCFLETCEGRRPYRAYKTYRTYKEQPLPMKKAPDFSGAFP